MERLIVILIVLGLILALPNIPSYLTYAQASSQLQPSPSPEVLGISQPIQTTSRFETKMEVVTQKVERNVVYKDDPETEIGEETVLQEGKDGQKKLTYEITLFEGQQYEKKLVSQENIDTEDKIVSKGTKIVWRTLDTPDGQIRYWRKMRVYATHYDSHCLGCNEWTAIGMRQGKGVIAVDPKVIKMRSEVYVPGYGKAVAGDTGGAIKGNIIDLGFDDARTAGWYAHYIDIYLM